jgi:hypothetical protein
MLLLLEFGLARSFDIYQKQSFLSLGSDDTADMEPWCTYAVIIIKFPRNPIDNQHRQSEDSFEIPLGRAKRQKINKYTTRGVNMAAVQVYPIDSSHRFANWRSLSQKVNIPQSGTSGSCKERAD